MSNRTELHDKIQQITAKIIELNAGFADKTALSTLDKDLLRKYAIDLYDTILQLKSDDSKPEPVVYATVTAPPPAPRKEPVEPVPYIEPAPPRIDAPMPKIENPAPQPRAYVPSVPEPEEEVSISLRGDDLNENTTGLVNVMPVATEVPVPPVLPPVENEAPPAPVKKKVEEAKTEPSLNDRLHQPGEGNDLVSKLQQTPIHDLKKAISINKKFEFINQLFKGDHEAYAKSIHYINGLNSSAEAATFLNNLKKQFGWDDENNLYAELADMIRRRFM